MWIARNKNGSLYAYAIKPDFDETFFCLYPTKDFSDVKITSLFMKLNASEFPEITFENSPVEIKTTTNISSILDVLTNLSKTLETDIEQENQKLDSCFNSSDILDKAYNYRLGLVNGYIHAQHLITQMFGKNVLEYLKTNKND